MRRVLAVFAIGLMLVVGVAVGQDEDQAADQDQDQGQTEGEEGEEALSGEYGSGNEDFVGLRDHHPGDQPSQIDWKSYARDRGLNTRMFSGQTSAPLWIDWQQAPGHDEETRISALARAVIDADGRGRPYGLRTPEGVIHPAQGPVHRHQCLRHLAVFGSSDA